MRGREAYLENARFSALIGPRFNLHSIARFAQSLQARAVQVEVKLV